MSYDVLGNGLPVSLLEEPQNSRTGAGVVTEAPRCSLKTMFPLRKYYPVLVRFSTCKTEAHEGTRPPTDAASEPRDDGSRARGTLFLL